MKIRIFIQLFIIFISITFSNLTFAFETSVAEKYNDIFTNNILSQSDMENNHEKYEFQEQSKCKKAKKNK